jgi:soluble lytic murein transglycosylase-like protein
MKGSTFESRTRRQPWLGFAGLLGGLVLVVSFLGAVASTVSWVAQSPVVVATVPLELLDSPTWSDRVQTYAARLEEAFELPEEVADRYAPWILDASDRQRVDPDLVAGLIYVESTFREHVRSHTGAMGPAQVNPRFWERHCGGHSLEDPAHNIQCGAIVLTHYADRCGGMACALRKYNVGPRNLERLRQASMRYLAKVDHFRNLIATHDQAL